jgi:phosphatidylglycerol---prolipoprotein diacylglyceryl transferase
VYPLVQLGPFSLSSGGLVLLGATLAASWWASRVARMRGGAALEAQVERAFLPLAAGALVGGRLWYGIFNWDLYGPNPALFLALRVADFAWPGALLGGMLVGWLWARLRRVEIPLIADTAALVLPPAHAIASLGLLLSGEAFGVPTELPWGLPLFGAVRHPTQLYYALAALVTWIGLRLLDRVARPVGTLFIAYLGLHGLTLLLVEPFRADSLLLPGGVRVAQVVGLVLIVAALAEQRRSDDIVRPRLRGSETARRASPESAYDTAQANTQSNSSL